MPQRLQSRSSVIDALAKLGLWDERTGAGDTPRPLENSATLQPLGCSLAAYAEAKRLPIDFLKSLGLSDVTYLNAPAIRIPYFGLDGTEGPVRFRLALNKGDDGLDARFRW